MSMVGAPTSGLSYVIYKSELGRYTVQDLVASAMIFGPMLSSRKSYFNIHCRYSLFQMIFNILTVAF